ncbi:MAG TPA: serine hydrolase domain-containing protein, partial [Gemmatimonadaceae bacterium]
MAASLGSLDAGALDALRDRLRSEVDEGRLPSCQFALARDNEVIVSETFGAAVADSRYVMFSATKAVVASAVWMLISEGLLDVSRRVVELVPSFGSNGKDVVTVEQVMLHTSGFPHAPFNALEWDDSDRRHARFAQWRLNWEPGTRYEYHPTSAHWVLAELIEQIAGADFRTFIRERVLEPLGLQRLRIGVPPAEQGDVNMLVATGEPATRDELLKAIGIPEIPLTEVTEEALLAFNQPAMRTVGVPGGGGITSAADMARF